MEIDAATLLKNHNADCTRVNAYRIVLNAIPKVSFHLLSQTTQARVASLVQKWRDELHVLEKRLEQYNHIFQYLTELEQRFIVLHYDEEKVLMETLAIMQREYPAKEIAPSCLIHLHRGILRKVADFLQADHEFGPVA